MQEIEKIRNLICEQIEINDCPACNEPTHEGSYIACNEHKRHHGILGEVLTALDQLEAKLNKEIDMGKIALAIDAEMHSDCLPNMDILAEAAIAEYERQKNE